MPQEPSVNWSFIKTKKQTPRYNLMFPLHRSPNKAATLASSPNFHELLTLCSLDLAEAPAGFGIPDPNCCTPLGHLHGREASGGHRSWYSLIAQVDLEQGTAARYCRNLRHIVILLIPTSCGITSMGIKSSYYTEQVLKPMHVGDG